MTLTDLVADAVTGRNDPIRALQVLRQLEPWLEPEEYCSAAERCAEYYLALLRFTTAERVRSNAKGRRKVASSLTLKIFGSWRKPKGRKTYAG